MGYCEIDNVSPIIIPLLVWERGTIRYQNNLNKVITKFNMEKQEAEYLLIEARNAQNAYQNVIKNQDDKISQLTMLVINLANRVEKLENGSGQVE